MALWTDSLRWNKAANQISTDARVKVVSEEGDTLSGIGFVSDAKLDHWRILSGVRGVFKKVEQRVKDFDGPASGADSLSSANASLKTPSILSSNPPSNPSSTAPATPTSSGNDPFALPSTENEP
jgi:hypothetical protein